MITEEEEKKIMIMEEEEMSTTTTTTILLPQDILMEILSRLPAKSLVSSFKLVCKAWCTTIKDPDFVKMHLNRGTINGGGGSLIRKDRYGPYGNTLFQLHLPFNCEGLPIEQKKKMDIDPNLLILESRLVGSCNGLLCLSANEFHGASVVLLNPSTRKYKVSPEERIVCPFGLGRVSTYGFGCYYNSTTGIDEYKVVRIACFYQYSDNPESFEFQIDIYSMSSNSWRRCREVKDMGCKQFQEGLSGVLVNGAFHWMGSKLRNGSRDTIVSFSIRDEEFGQVQMPPCVDVGVNDNGMLYPPYSNHYTVLMNVRGCLGKVYVSRTEIMDIELEIWVMNEYGIGESWTKEFVIRSSDSDPCRELFESPVYSGSITCFLAGDQILIEGRVFISIQTGGFNNDLNLRPKGLARKYGRRVLYDMNKKNIDGDIRMFDMPDHEDYRVDQVDYIETLVSLKSSNNRKRKDTESLRNRPFEDVFYFKQQLEGIILT